MQFYNEKHISSLQRVETLFLQGTPLAISWSGGKDSSVLLDLTLTSAISAKEKGASPYILVTHGDTGVENPEIAAYVKTEARKILAFAKEQGIKLDYHVAKPHLNATWAVQIISGRKLPSFPQNNSDCSVDWKVKPMTSLRKRLMKDVIARTGQEAVTLVGTRYDESAARAKKMTDRGDTHLSPTRNKDGDLVFAVLADWSTDEIWEWIGMTRSGLLTSYSDYNDLNRLYADAGGTSCSVVSDTITEGTKKARGQCGARFGCGVCCAVQNDKSLTTMIGMDHKRYGYMSPLNKLREFIVNTQWDFSRRQWVGRTIDKNGMIAIRPDTYSPEMCLELLRYALTIDAEEREAAYIAGLPPRFELVSLKSLVAIDAIWSLQAMHKPFQAIKEYRDIVDKGIRYAIPDLPEYPRTPMPATRYLYVGDSWDSGKDLFSGMRDFRLEMLHGSDTAGGCMGNRRLKSGKIVLDVETDTTFDVDLEGACLVMDFEIDRMIDIHENSNGKHGLTEGYRWWIRMGTVALSPQQINMHNEILKRSSFKERMGLAGPRVDMDYIFSLTESPVYPTITHEPLKSATKFKKEIQLDIFSVFTPDDSPAAV